MTMNPIQLSASSDEGTILEIEPALFRVDKLVTHIHNYLGNNLGEFSKFLVSNGLPGLNHVRIFSTPVSCRILRPNAQGWQQGKVTVKVYLEFRPDEPPEKQAVAEIAGLVEVVAKSRKTLNSPLDTIRQATEVAS